MGKPQKKFVVIICDTLPQAKLQMDAIKQKLEDDELLKNDLGPFEDDSPEWGAYTIVFKNFNARILVMSVESKIRGIHHGKYRPDLIICDDVESTASVKTKEGRDKVYRWLKLDVIGAGEFRKTRLVIVGNLLHEDSLLMRLKREVKNGEIDGVFKAYPLIDKAGRVAWPDKYKDEAAIEAQKKEIGNPNAFLREFMLKIVPEDDQVITREMLHHYDKLPNAEKGHLSAYLGIDLAIGQKETNDYTAMVSIVTQGTGKNFKAYVLQNPVNQRMNFPEIMAKVKERYRSLKSAWPDVKIRVESNQFQQAAVDQLKFDGIHSAEGVTVTTDKRSRLASCADLINDGIILFPKTGAENLITQMMGLGVESHDDILDAFTLLVRSFIEEGLIEDRYNGVKWAG
jgi:predicted phage terminase large subunit-like protein